MSTLVLALLCTMHVHAQELTATRLHLKGPAWDGVHGALLYTDDVIPLVIANASPTAQPITLLGGASASLRALEIGAAAETWIRGSLSVGEYTGAGPGEMMRVATLQPTNGKGLVVDLAGTTTSTGIHVIAVGATGSDNAGILITSTTNGTGTGMRIGGPTGAGRPTLGTGIEITGGTGVRYNALYATSGTGIEIGGTTPPLCGVDAIAGGQDHIGVLGRGNTIGAGVIGLSQSNSYTDVPYAQGVGVLGRSATNSTASSDTLFGVKGITIRGGSGGTQTLSVGVFGEAQTTATSHSGFNVGVFGVSQSPPVGQGFPYAGLFIGHQQGMSIVALGSDVYLGSDILYRPPQVPMTAFPQEGRSLTHIFSSRTSGIPSLVNPMSITIPTGTVAADLHIENVPIVRIISGINGVDVTGIDGGIDGRVVTLFNVGVRLGIHNQGYDSTPENRILTPAGLVLNIPANGAVTFWYDGINQRWRVLSSSR